MTEPAPQAGPSETKPPEVDVKARRYAADLGGLYRLSQQLTAESEEAGILKVAVSAARRILSAQAVAIFVPAGTGPQSLVRCAACDGTAEKTALAQQAVVSLQSQGLLADAMREARTMGVGVRTLAASPQAIADGWEERSAIAVPLAVSGGTAVPAVEHGLEARATDGGATGAVVWVFEGREPVGLEEVGLAEEVARQIASGLRRARLVAQTQQQTEELKLLDQIGRSLSQRLTVAHTLEQTVRNVSKIAVMAHAAVFVLDQATQIISTYASNPPLSQFPKYSVPLNGHSVVAACMREGRTQVVSDVDKDPRCDAAAAHRYGASALICVSLGAAPQRFGVLLVAKHEPGEYSPDEVRRVEQVAQLASGAIERARLYEEACRRADELILLNEVGHLLVESPALEGTLQRIAELVSRHFDLAGAGFLLLDESRRALVSSAIFGAHSPEIAGVRIPLEAPTITTLALRQNQTLVIENADTDTRVERTLLQHLPGAASGAVIPMAGTGGPAGVFGVWKTQPYVFQPHELQCLGNVARLAAAAVGRGELVRALQASEKRLQEVVDGIHDILVSIDPQGNVLSFNAAAERMTGHKQAEVLGCGLAGVVNLNAAERGRLEKYITRAFQTLNCSEQLVLNWPSHEGGERKIRWRSSFLRSPGGKVTGMVCLGVDITEQTLLEAQLLQAQKMESVGALAGGMAHDFNNLLGGIIGQCAVARSQTRDEGMLGSLANIESAAHRGADLTAKLMTFARKSVLQPRAVNFGTLIQETVSLLSGSFPRTIEIVSHVAPDLPLVHGDPTQLQQVLVNLCVNARDAMPDGGTLTISAVTDEAGDASLEPGGVRVNVSDTGTGMTEEVQQHLFEPFFTTKQPGKGTGLGLSVVFGILRSHGGHIACNSALGKGTCFSIRLPRARPPRGKTDKLVFASGGRYPAGASLASAASFAGRENLLLVDDDAILRETMRQLLENLGYTVRTARGGAEALQLLDAGAGFVPDAILLDVVMPGLAGLALFAEFRGRLPRVPVILMSGYSTDQTVIGMLEAGARELIQKPFTIETIAGAIRRSLAGNRGEGLGTAADLEYRI